MTYSWKEIKKKEAAIAAAPSKYNAILRGATDDDIRVVNLDYTTDYAENSWIFNAAHELLNQIGLPKKLKLYAFTLLSVSRNYGTEVFQASNKEIARLMGVSDKTVTRQRNKFLAWQNQENIFLIGFRRGEFDPKRMRNEVGSYQIYLHEYLSKAILVAKADTRWNRLSAAHITRARQGSVFKTAVRTVLEESRDVPPLKVPAKRELTDGEILNRMVNTIRTMNGKFHDILHKNAYDPAELRLYLDLLEEYEYLTQPGITGNILNDSNLEPAKVDVWGLIKQGMLADEIERLQYLVEYLKIPESDRPDIFPNRADNFTGIEHDNSSIEEISDSNLLKTIAHRGDILSSREEVENEMKQSQVLPILENWKARINEKIPPLQLPRSGWEITWQIFTSEGARTEDALNMAILKCEQRNLDISDVKERFLDYVMARLRFWRDGVPFPQPDSKLIEFRAKLPAYLKTDG